MMALATLAAGVAFVVGLVIGSIFFGSRCKHDWEPVVERELPSKAEELKKNGEDLTTWRLPSQLIEISSKVFFAIVSCKKCGAVKDFTLRT